MIFLAEESISDFEAEVGSRRPGGWAPKPSPRSHRCGLPFTISGKPDGSIRAEVSAVNQAVNSIVDSFYDSMDSSVSKLSANFIARRRPIRSPG